MNLRAWNSLVWLIFAAYWLIAALWRSKTQRSEPVRERLFYVLSMLLGAILVFPALSVRPQPNSWIVLAHLTVLDRHFLPPARWLGILGDVCTSVGVAFAIWARSHIGRYWSGQVRIAHGHRLIRSGPYARIRHPIYTGILLALAGTVLVIAEYRALLGAALLLAGLIVKARKEELYLGEKFGEEFQEHRRATGFLLPR